MDDTALDGLDHDLSRDPLWARIEAYPFDALDPGEPFSARLARENLWSAPFAERVVEEYRRFCYLAVRVGHPVAPSDAVDRVWQEHFSHSREYREGFCAGVLGTDLHHAPMRLEGRAGEEDRQRYEATLSAYERLSGEKPPSDIWPVAAVRFSGGKALRRVDARDHLIVRRPPRGVFWVAQVGLVVGALYGLWHGALAAAILLGVAAGALSFYRDGTDNRWTVRPWRDGEDGGHRTGGRGGRETL